MRRSITSADSIFSISSQDFALAATILEGYTADAAFAIESAETAETRLGVDGKLAAGWVPRTYTQTITLEADSPSVKVFQLIVAAQDAARNVFRLSAVITLPGNQMAYEFRGGVLKSIMAMPNAQRALQAQTFTIEWEGYLPVPLA